MSTRLRGGRAVVALVAVLGCASAVEPPPRQNDAARRVVELFPSLLDEVREIRADPVAWRTRTATTGFVPRGS